MKNCDNWTINNVGKVAFEWGYDSKGDIVKKIARDFLEEIIEEIAKICFEYQNAIDDDHLFFWGERQFDGAVCPAISKVSDAFIMRHPIGRKKRGHGRWKGRIDYWAHYDNINVFLELKHWFANWSGYSEKIDEILNDAIAQVNTVTDFMGDVGVRGQKNVKIALVSFYVRCLVWDKQKDDFWDVEPLEFLKNRWFQNNNINFKSVWKLHDDLIIEFPRGKEKKKEIFPYLGFIANVSPIID